MCINILEAQQDAIKGRCTWADDWVGQHDSCSEYAAYWGQIGDVQNPRVQAWDCAWVGPLSTQQFDLLPAPICLNSQPLL